MTSSCVDGYLLVCPFRLNMTSAHRSILVLLDHAGLALVHLLTIPFGPTFIKKIIHHETCYEYPFPCHVGNAWCDCSWTGKSIIIHHPSCVAWTRGVHVLTMIILFYCPPTTERTPWSC
jgi:hypothetical protein